MRSTHGLILRIRTSSRDDGILRWRTLIEPNRHGQMKCVTQPYRPPNHQTTRNAQEYPEVVVGEPDPEGEMEDASTTSEGP